MEALDDGFVDVLDEVPVDVTDYVLEKLLESRLGCI